MIETSGIVLKADTRSAIVAADRQVGCGNCDITKVCATPTLFRLFGACSTKISVINTVQAQVGDRVTIAVDDGAVLKVSAAVYLVPLALLMTGAILGSQFSGPPPDAEANSVAGAATGLLLGICWLKFYNFFARSKQALQPYILNANPPGIFTIKREVK